MKKSIWQHWDELKEKHNFPREISLQRKVETDRTCYELPMYWRAKKGMLGKGKVLLILFRIKHTTDYSPLISEWKTPKNHITYQFMYLNGHWSLEYKSLKNFEPLCKGKFYWLAFLECIKEKFKT